MEDPSSIWIPLENQRGGTGGRTILANIHDCMVGLTATVKDLDEHWEQRTFIHGTKTYVLIHRKNGSSQLTQLPSIDCACGQAGVWHTVDTGRYKKWNYEPLVKAFENLVGGGKTIAPKPSARLSGRSSITRASARTTTQAPQKSQVGLGRPPLAPKPPTQAAQPPALRRSSVPVTDDYDEQLMLDNIDQMLARSRGPRYHSPTELSVERLARLLEHTYPGQLLVVVMDELAVRHRPPEQLLADERRRWDEFHQQPPARVVVLVDVARPSVYHFLANQDGVDLIIHRQEYFH